MPDISFFGTVIASGRYVASCDTTWLHSLYSVRFDASPCVISSVFLSAGKRSLEPILDDVYEELHTRFAVGEPVEAALIPGGKQ